MIKRFTSFLTALILVLGVGSVNVFASDFSVTEVSVPEGVIPSGIGEIVVTMSDVIDPDTIDNIRFVRSDGTDVKGGCYVEIGDNDTQAVVSFGRLDKGDYRLELDSELLSKDGVAATPKTCEYSVENGLNGQVLLYEDFQDIEPGEYTRDELKEHLPAGLNITGSNAVYEIVESPSGRRYTKMGVAAGKTGGGWSTVKLESPISEGTINIDVDYSGDAGTYAKNLLSIYVLESGKEKNKKYTHGMSSGYGNGKANSTATCGAPGGAITRDSDSFWSLRYVISRGVDDESWTVKGYDKANNMTEIFSGSIPVNTIPVMQNFYLMDGWGAASTGGYCCVDEICVWTTDEQKLVYADKSAAVTDDELNIVLFDDETEDNIDAYLMLDGSRVDAEVTYDADNRRITVNPVDYLMRGEEYILGFTSGDYSGEVTVSIEQYPAALTDAVYSEGKISFDFDGDKSLTDLKIFAVGYDAEGKLMQGAVAADFNPDNKEISAETLAECTTVKLMVWEVQDGYMRPVCQTAELSINN